MIYAPRPSWNLLSVGLSLGLCVIAQSAQAQVGSKLGDAVLFNGVFLTVDSQNRTWSVIRVQGDRITAVGNKIGDIGPLSPTTKQIDLRGATVVPGLIDTHIHFMRGSQIPGYFIRGIETAFSLAELSAAVTERARTAPTGSFLTFVGGVNRKQFTENRMPTLAELDTAAPNHPVYVQQGFRGPSATNSLGRTFLRGKNVTVAADGSITGSNVGAALTELALAQTTTDADRALRDYVHYANSVGLTMVMNYSGCSLRGFGVRISSPACTDEPYALWQAKRLNLRMSLGYGSNSSTPDGNGIYPIIPAMQAALTRLANRGGGDAMLDVNRTGEFVVGDFGSTTAPFAAAYGQVAGKGWGLSQHSMSNAENNAHISAFETVNATTPIAPFRWTLDHVFSITTADLSRLNKLGAGLAVQNQQYLLSRSGPPYRRIVDSRIPVGGGTDATGIVPMTPWASIYHMVSGRDAAGRMVNSGQQITRLEALRIYTMGSAWITFAEKNLGSIEVGKLADLVVLNDDYLKIPEADVRSLRSVMTIIGGTIVFTDSDGFSTYGCGFNPINSLTTLSGSPTIGTTWTVGVDNPLGTQPKGSFAALWIAFAPDPNFPCGSQLPGFGMGGAGAVGELLVTLNGSELFVGPSKWNGAGNPMPFPLPIPTGLPILLGLEIFLQGIIADFASSVPVPIGLTEGISARIR